MEGDLLGGLEARHVAAALPPPDSVLAHQVPAADVRRVADPRAGLAERSSSLLKTHGALIFAAFFRGEGNGVSAGGSGLVPATQPGRLGSCAFDSFWQAVFGRKERVVNSSGTLTFVCAHVCPFWEFAFQHTSKSGTTRLQNVREKARERSARRMEL